MRLIIARSHLQIDRHLTTSWLLALPQVEAAARQEADGANADLKQQLADARRQVDEARRAGASDLAASRDQLAASRREVAASSGPIAAAQDAQRAAEASLAACRATLAEREGELEAARAEVVAAREAAEDEGRTRVFLERVLKDERVHAARRAEEAAALHAAREERDDLEQRLVELHDVMTRASYEINESLLDRATRDL